MQARNFKKLLFVTFSSLLLVSVSFAQNIKLAGKVINTKNEPVAGASILIEELKRTIVANLDGQFDANLEVGKKYTFTVSSVGYNTKVVSDIEVGANADNNITVVLEPQSKNSEAIVIRSTRRQESTVALLTFQRTNTALSSGLAADFIRRTPDKNTGEVLKRVSGASIQDNKFVIVRGLSDRYNSCLLYTSPSPRDRQKSRMPSSA